MDFHTGTTAEGDGTESRFTTLIGMNSSDGRGNIMLGLQAQDRDVVYQRDRAFYKNGWYDPGTVAGGFLFAPGYSFGAGAPRPTQAAVDQIFFDAHGFAPGTINVTPGLPGVVNEIYWNPDGTPFTLQGARGYTGPFASTVMGDGYAGMRINPNGNLGQVNETAMLSTPNESRSVFGRATYDLSDDLSLYTQMIYANNTVTTTGGIPPAITVWQALVPNDGLRTIPSGLQTLLDSRANAGADWALFRGLDFNDGQPFTTDNTNDVWQLMVGLQGVSRTATGPGTRISRRARPIHATTTATSRRCSAIRCSSELRISVKEGRSSAATTSSIAIPACRSSAAARTRTRAAWSR
jgi:iron complex outermembrane recepter protein